MPRLETSPVEQRKRFIADDRLALYSRVEALGGGAGGVMRAQFPRDWRSR
jgi:hypothetical protein